MWINIKCITLNETHQIEKNNQHMESNILISTSLEQMVLIRPFEGNKEM